MKFSKFFSPFSNQFIGPIIISSIIIVALIIFYIPKVSKENQIESITQSALSTVNKLKKIRSYYTTNVVNDIKNRSNTMKINYDHIDKEDTIPLPATLLHNLSEILPENGRKVKLFSHYPFPNRKDRVLDADEEEALKFIEANPHDTYVKLVKKGEKQFVKVTVSDIFYDQACVSCHNTRADTPKSDWKLGDVRGALQVTIPFKDEIVLNSDQTIYIFVFFVFLIMILGIHYTYVAYKQKHLYTNTKEQLEQQIAKRTKTLNEYKKAVDLSAIVSKTDANGRITYINEEFIKISGYNEEELIGKNHNIVRHPDMPDEVFKDLWSTIKSKKVWKGQIKNRTKDGRSYYVASTIVPLTNEQDEIEEFLAIRLDISQIIESKIQAEKADMTKSTFLANMSHEIRTPLNAIIGFSQVLSNAKDISIENKKQASIIESSANSLLMIINDILDISKIESGNFQVNIGNTDLYFISEHVVELFTKRAAQKNIKFIFNMDHRLPLCVQTDGTRIRQVLSNILSNAIKFTDSYGSIYLNILLLDDEKSKVVVRFEIVDTGIGIPENKLENIFQPFVQVDSQVNRKYEGTGLGLSICSHIIETFGSKIEVESTEGMGTRFCFDIEFDTCEEVMFEKSHFTRDVEFAICDNNSDLYHYAKRYLSIFGKLNFTDFEQSDIFVLSYDEQEGSSFEELRNSSKKPKLILVEYEQDIKRVSLRSNEVVVALPFYASKLNDAIQELINNSNDFANEMKKVYKFEGRILVAEDNFANQELITFILQSVGVEFDIATNGKEAVALYKNNQYDIVLMDINMPILDGIEAFKQIREYEKEETKSYTPIIALTANAIKGDKEKFLSIGMDDYMSKPIEMEKLKELFGKFLIESQVIETAQTKTEEKQEQIESQKIHSQASEEFEKDAIVLDPAKIASTLGVSENIAKMLISKFKKEIPNDLKELENFIEASDFDGIKNKAHFIKNSCLNLGLNTICDDIQQIETELKDIEQLKIKFQALKSDILGIS